MAYSSYPTTFTATSNTGGLVTITPSFPAPPDYILSAKDSQEAARDLLGKITNKESEFMSASRIGIKNGAPTTHANARDEGYLLATDAQQTIDGWVGQVLIEGLPVWQSEAFPVEGPSGVDDKYDPVAAALKAARTKVSDTFRTLFGASQAPSVPTGFTTPQTPGA